MILFGKKKEAPPVVYSEITCNSCGEKSRRPFEEGDYVFRKSDNLACEKCGSLSGIVSSIYGEYAEEDKKKS
jgi:hypothetical protein